MTWHSLTIGPPLVWMVMRVVVLGLILTGVSVAVLWWMQDEGD